MSGFRYKLFHTFALSSHAFLMKKLTLSVLSHQETLNTNIIIVEMREQGFLQAKNYSNRH